MALAQQFSKTAVKKNTTRAARRSAPRVQAVARPAKAQVATAEKAVVDVETVDKCINAIRFLAIDGVEKANSGHPGMPMGCAPMGYILYNEEMQHNPKNPAWFNRDRFVLSCGHGSMFLYSLLHLTGYDSVNKEDLMSFRQWGSRTPGHPENFMTAGIEVTTGPLGTGICNAVGLAMSEAHLAARYNKEGTADIVDHYTYCIMGDGCNMEGVSGEACSLAGHYGLGKLIVFYDDNKISIDGHTDISFTEDVSARYEAYGWHTQHVTDGNTGYDSIRDAIAKAKAVTDKPSFIKVSTIIGYGSPNKANSHDVHGAALGADEVAATRENLGWEYAPFEVPAEVSAAMDNSGRGAAAEAAWEADLAAYAAKFPEEAAEFKQLISGDLPAGWEKALPTYTSEDKGIATRLHSQTNLNALADVLPGFLGGSADLAPSNMTLMKQFGDFQKGSYEERNLRFGVREHGMGAICNGIALHTSGLIPYCATFFIFSDYMRGAMRVAALSGAGVIHVMTHDSIGLGEDGPTHQPVEHLASFRAMPGMLMFRPADGNETAGSYKVAVERRGTASTLALSRQGVPNYDTTSIAGVEKGAYVVHGAAAGAPCDCVLVGTGTELQLAMEAGKELEAAGKTVRVVSMPCWELADEQGPEYLESLFPKALKAKVSIEAGSTMGWMKYTGSDGIQIGIDKFGASAPAQFIYDNYGITKDAVVEAAKSLM